MKVSIRKIGAAFVAVGLCIGSTQALAQATTTVTTAKGAFTQYVPGSQTVVVRSETNPNAVRYVVTKRTTVVDQSGTPVALERIPAGSPLSIQYAESDNHPVASRIVVQRPIATQKTTTTTSTTRTLTHDEKEKLKEAQEERLERQKEAIEDAQDRLEDDDGD